MTLYKYKTIEKNSLKYLISNEIYFSKTSDFNDPFDGQVLPDSLLDDLEKMNIDVSNSPLANHNDYLKVRLNGFSVFCMSEKNDDILMWSHYADSHKGICFGFKEKIEGYIPNEAPIYSCKVDYIDKHPYIDLYKDINSGRAYNSGDLFKDHCNMANDLLNTSLTKKHISWIYEKEIRIISEEGAGPRSFYPEALERVILGMNISSGDEQIVKELLKDKKWEHVVLHKARPSKAKLGIDIICV
jgi:hypothetical protein